MKFSDEVRFWYASCFGINELVNIQFGLPLMLISIIHVEAKKSKRDEFLNTLTALGKRFNQSSGCIAYHLGRDLENENLFQLVGEWQTQEDYDKHVNSPEFEVLQGAIRILGLTPQVRILKMDEDVIENSNEGK